MAKTASGLVAYAKEQKNNGACYWYGCWGQKGSQKLMDEKTRQYPSQYPPRKWTVESFTCQFEKRVYDCAGLIKGYMFETGNGQKYDSKYDVSANSMIALCTEQGDYASIPDIAGLVVWKDGHIGVYIGRVNGKPTCIEAKGHAYGVVQTTDTKWKKWGKLPWLQYEDPKQTCDVDLPVLQCGMNGVNVQRAQYILVGLQFKDQYGELIKADGDFGERTEYCVRQFQKLLGLPNTGIIDKSTWKKLLDP